VDREEQREVESLSEAVPQIKPASSKQTTSQEPEAEVSDNQQGYPEGSENESITRVKSPTPDPMVSIQRGKSGFN
jgi:hypothetical protein